MFVCQILCSDTCRLDVLSIEDDVLLDDEIASALVKPVGISYIEAEYFAVLRNDRRVDETSLAIEGAVKVLSVVGLECLCRFIIDEAEVENVCLKPLCQSLKKEEWSNLFSLILLTAILAFVEN